MQDTGQSIERLRYHMSMQTLTIQTDQRDQFIAITSQVRSVVREAAIQQGQAIIYVPHTTAGVTINENADPDVVTDMIGQLDRMVPWRQNFYRHAEGNTASHVKASMMGSSATVLIENGELVLGTWQGIFFCEFDGPRTRKVHVQVRGDS
jgi:secondary thiamine-phosphate synthase enzyme